MSQTDRTRPSDEFVARILTDKELYLASPAQFEDKYDCKVPIRYDLF